ncbi:hypothetical protein [Halostreptopolyspora alba]|uniref:Uncharacterized protein n=1 Tax=Halostreptopolyspora alba TaxID=2487137 RepID=A0A3N0E647_9ACTN|nr:hypothetical protein EFW17_16390 [Nocardiopsaceae bacterium YIM 96095]
MGMTLISEDTWVEERFRELVGELEREPSGTVTAKLSPVEDPNATPEPEREGEGSEHDPEESESDRRESQDDRE